MAVLVTTRYSDQFHDARKRHDDDTLVTLNRELDRISTRRARLLGLDAPERADVNVNVSTDPTALLDKLEAVMLERDDQRQRQLPAIIDAEVIEPRETA